MGRAVTRRIHAPTWLRLTPGLFVFLWSTGFIGTKLGMPYTEPMTFLSVRFFIVAILMAAISAAAGATWPRLKDARHAMIAGALMHGGYLGGVFWSIGQGMPAGVAAIIVGLQPLITAILAGMAVGERLSLRNWIGLALGLLGVALVVWPKLTLGGEGITPATIAACFLGVLAIAAGSVYQKRFATELDMRTAAVWQYVGGFLFAFPIALATESLRVEWTGEFAFALGWLVLVLSVGAISLYMLLIRHGEVSKVASLFYLVPAVTAVLAYFLFGETLGPVQIAGMVVSMFGVALASRASRARPTATG